jgi:hypothetical protein
MSIYYDIENSIKSTLGSGQACGLSYTILSPTRIYATKTNNAGAQYQHIINVSSDKRTLTVSDEEESVTTGYALIGVSSTKMLGYKVESGKVYVAIFTVTSSSVVVAKNTDYYSGSSVASTMFGYMIDSTRFLIGVCESNGTYPRVFMGTISGNDVTFSDKSVNTFSAYAGNRVINLGGDRHLYAAYYSQNNPPFMTDTYLSIDLIDTSGAIPAIIRTNIYYEYISGEYAPLMGFLGLSSSSFVYSYKETGVMNYYYCTISGTTITKGPLYSYSSSYYESDLRTKIDSTHFAGQRSTGMVRYTVTGMVISASSPTSETPIGLRVEDDYYILWTTYPTGLENDEDSSEIRQFNMTTNVGVSNKPEIKTRANISGGRIYRINDNHFVYVLMYSNSIYSRYAIELGIGTINNSTITTERKTIEAIDCYIDTNGDYYWFDISINPSGTLMSLIYLDTASKLTTKLYSISTTISLLETEELYIIDDYYNLFWGYKKMGWIDDERYFIHILDKYVIIKYHSGTLTIGTIYTITDTWGYNFISSFTEDKSKILFLNSSVYSVYSISDVSLTILLSNISISILDNPMYLVNTNGGNFIVTDYTSYLPIILNSNNSITIGTLARLSYRWDYYSPPNIQRIDNTHIIIDYQNDIDFDVTKTRHYQVYIINNVAYVDSNYNEIETSLWSGYTGNSDSYQQNDITIFGYQKTMASYYTNLYTYYIRRVSINPFIVTTTYSNPIFFAGND